MGRVVLLGVSIFVNARYIPGGPSVIEHPRRILSRDFLSSLLVVDGATAEDVAVHPRRLPVDATHLVAMRRICDERTDVAILSSPEPSVGGEGGRDGD